MSSAAMTIAAIVTAAAAVFAIVVEMRQSRFAMRIDLLRGLDADFWDQEMQDDRALAARHLLDAIENTANADGADDILDFFEMIAYYEYKGALDAHAVWLTFFYWIHGYISAAGERVASVQMGDATQWILLLKLHKKLVRIESRQRRCSPEALQLDRSDQLSFLREEAGRAQHLEPR